MKKFISITMALSIFVAYPTTSVLAQPNSNDMSMNEDRNNNDNDDNNGQWGLLGLLGLLGLAGLKKKEHTSTYTTSGTPQNR